MASILVSEVEPDVRQLFVRLIERLGHEAIVLGDDVVVPSRADLLLVDPIAQRSVEHLRLVRAFFPELPVVCLNPLPDSVGYLGRGPVLFLPKPFAPQALEETFEQAISASSSLV